MMYIVMQWSFFGAGQWGWTEACTLESEEDAQRLKKLMLESGVTRKVAIWEVPARRVA